ncbi:AraC family ligand binding domain-containing protein [Vibrio parahaemolyticus]|nr:AraC family ligand binding domain-containing protein [Vibrio parahaemolyticus]MDN4716140.1 AraC family ligand binding domain-containing protein [Vibrio parahaemolyticus]MDN4720114.1 AraC family ligand binding domain-containing protein [Vibrio parahaemolyticus]MDN4722906.1 AraC family ligand binding domain-containing protein [Vibrio parahaemolyticus]MDN4726910.1 AraC family ligand binding domain-containing protein [Vibrio parahaemolyticus]
MKGFIINITSQGEGTIFHGNDAFDVKTGDLLLFPPSATHFYHRKKTMHHGFTAGSIFVLVPFGMTGCVGMNNEMVCISLKD